MSDLYIVMYHYTRDLKCSRYPRIKGLDLKLFEQQLEFFSANFNVVTMESVIEAWNSGDRSLLPPNALLLTFDDGYIDNYLNAFPLLVEYHMQGSFFVSGKTINENKVLDVNKIQFILANGVFEKIYNDLLNKMDYYRGNEYRYPSNEELLTKYRTTRRYDPVEVVFVKKMLQSVLPKDVRTIIINELFQEYVGVSEEVFSRELYMNREQIRIMKREGMFIGLHGYDHCWFGEMEEGQIKRDFEKMLDVMEEFINPNSWVLNYPYGSVNERVISIAEEKGCRLGMGIETSSAKMNCNNKFLLPRLDCNDFPPKSNNWQEM